MKLQIATLKLDVTPPIGAQMAYGINREVDSPIYIRGLIVDDGVARAVILACDYIHIIANTWYEWRETVAKAAGTTPARVYLHSLHQHDSLRIAPEWNPLMAPFGREAISDDYCNQTIAALQATVATAVSGPWQSVTQLLTSERRLTGLASNRRMIDAAGHCYAMRFSQCNDRELQALPTGRIDPLLRTIAFADSRGDVVAALHTYASHPMAAYLRDKVGADVPGVALDHADRFGNGKTFNIYLTGCGGNVTFGKYHLGDKEKTLALLGRRLGEGICANLRRLEPATGEPLTFATAEFDFPLDPTLNEEELALQATKGRPDGSPDLSAIRRLIIMRNWERFRTCTVSRLTFGPGIHFLSLPGEMAVEYQLYAQALQPEAFVACAAYGNITYGYIPTAEMYREGGYEPEVGAITTPAVDPLLRNALKELLVLS